MKKLGFLLKLSFISVVSTMFVSNNYIQTIIGIGQANAGELLDANKYGNYGDVGNHFIRASIMNSNAKWAKEALQGNEYTSSIKKLNDIVSVYEDSDEYSLNHSERIECLRSKIKTIIEKYSTPSNRYISIDEWGKTTYGDLVMSRMNCLMACCTLHEYSETVYRRTVYNKTIKQLYNGIFGGIMDLLSDDEKGSTYLKGDNRRFKVTLNPLVTSILNHFGYNDTEDNLDKALNAFKQCLWNEFYCYFVQTGLIHVDKKSGPIRDQSVLDKIKDVANRVDSIRKDINEHVKIENDEKGSITDIVKNLDKNNKVSVFMDTLNTTLKSYNCTPLSGNIFDLNYLTALTAFYKLSLTGSQLSVLEFHKKLVTDLLNKKIIKQSELTTDLVLFILNDFVEKNYETLSEERYKPAHNVSNPVKYIGNIQELFDILETEIIDQAKVIKDTADKLKLTNLNIRVLLKAAFILTKNQYWKSYNDSYDGLLSISSSMINVFAKTGPYRQPWAYDFEYVIQNALPRKGLTYY